VSDIEAFVAPLSVVYYGHLHVDEGSWVVVSTPDCSASDDGGP
jgi:hypothetical protein